MTEGDQATAEDGPLRIGTAERTAAMRALDAHLEAGRLGVEEYADRSAVAANAVVAAELAGLFADLPAPHPELPGTPARVVPPTAPLPVVPAAGAVAERPGGFLDHWGTRIVAVTPFVALALFFATGNHWQWFLLIPVVSALIYGGRAGRDGGRDRDRR